MLFNNRDVNTAFNPTDLPCPVGNLPINKCGIFCQVYHKVSLLMRLTKSNGIAFLLFEICLEAITERHGNNCSVLIRDFDTNGTLTRNRSN